MSSQRYLCDYAWLGGDDVQPAVLVEVSGGRIVSVAPRSFRAGVPGTVILRGLTMPGLANVHSHAFHRALRGRTHGREGGLGSFWTWREQMYDLAARLTPDSYLSLARATYAEMALAGITCVGEFHYLHHGPGGRPYDDPNEMGSALVQAAHDAGVRLTLLDTCYLTGGPGQPLKGVQERFGDGTAQAWAQRVEDLWHGHADSTQVLVGAAVHSVRGVPPDQIGTVAAWASERSTPLHAHVSEQPAENEASQAAYGRTPTQVLADTGALGPRSTAVHATHLADGDVRLLGGSGTGACFCPTTERDLADGVGPARALVDSGSPLSLGSDSHAVIDLFEEARAVELDERLQSRLRGHFSAAELLTAATRSGHDALGWPEAGVIAAGAIADLVTVRLDSVRTAGGGPTLGMAVFSATASDVTHVVASGRVVVRDGVHVALGDVGRLLGDAIDDLRDDGGRGR